MNMGVPRPIGLFSRKNSLKNASAATDLSRRFNPSGAHLKPLARPLKRRKRAFVDARDPDLRSEFHECVKQRRAPLRVEKCRDIVEEYNGGRAMHGRHKASVREHDADKECLALAGRSASRGDAFARMDDREIR
jgi:hypothetical protein